MYSNFDKAYANIYIYISVCKNAGLVLFKLKSLLWSRTLGTPQQRNNTTYTTSIYNCNSSLACYYREHKICTCMHFLTITCSLILIQIKSFTASTHKAADCVHTDLLTTTIINQTLIEIWWETNERMSQGHTHTFSLYSFTVHAYLSLSSSHIIFFSSSLSLCSLMWRMPQLPCTCTSF